MKKKIVFFVFLLFFLLYSYTSKSYCVETVIAPFVSKIEVAASGKNILLHWENPAKLSDYLAIYRYNKPISSAEILSLATKIAILKNKETEYVDSPPYGKYFYAILIVDKKTGEEKKVLVPFRNFTQKEAVISKDDVFEITYISAKSNKKSIQLEWNYVTESKKEKKLLIYRNTQSITNKEILKKAINIAKVNIDSKVFVDIPVANIEYYYYIVPENQQQNIFIPNVNITMNPVSVTAKANEALENFSIDNFIPLPLLALQTDPKSGEYFADPMILKMPKREQYNKKIRSIIEYDREKNIKIYNMFMKGEKQKLKKKQILFLSDDSIFEGGIFTPEYKNAIEFIKKRSYNKALTLLNELITENLSDNLLPRVAYYIGLIYYWQDNYYMSYIYFVLSLDTFPKQVKHYLKSIYLKIFENVGLD